MQNNKNCYKRGKEGWVLAFSIIICFLLISTAQSVLAQMATIGSNWNQHRCNPFFMPIASLFGHEPQGNFTNCMFSTQSGLMGGFLKPLFFLTDIMGAAAGGLASGLQNVRGFVGKLRGSLGGLFGIFFGFIGVLFFFLETVIFLLFFFFDILGFTFGIILNKLFNFRSFLFLFWFHMCFLFLYNR